MDTEPEGFLERIIASSPVLIFRATTDDLRFSYLSANITSLLGYAPEEALGVPGWWPAHVHPEDRERVLERLERDKAAKAPLREHEYRVLHKDGAYRWFHVVRRIEYDQTGDPVALVGYCLDITARKQMEDALHEAEVQFRSLVEQLPVVVYIAEFGETGAWVYVSPRIESILGFPPEEWTADPALWMRRIHPDDLPRVMEEEDRSRDSGEAFMSEYRMLARDGRVVWVRDEAEVVEDASGNPSHLRGVLLDISERKQAEEELKENMELLRRTDAERRRLLERVVSGQEEDRRSLASDIYDGPLEKMTALGLHLEVLRRRCSEPDQLEVIVQLEENMEQAVGHLRHLIFELSPPALEREGLAAALRLYLDETAEEAGFDYHVENRLVDEPAPETRVTLYRIAREALNNVRKHANANRVGVLLEPREDGFFVQVADDGMGFAPEEAAASLTGAVGLAAMRERAEMAGGWCRVESAPGRGATVEFWLPATASGERPPR